MQPDLTALVGVARAGHVITGRGENGSKRLFSISNHCIDYMITSLIFLIMET